MKLTPTELTPMECSLIQNIRRGAKDDKDDIALTISFAGPGVRVRWESMGFQGNGHGATFDEAYEQAWLEYTDKIRRVARAKIDEDTGSTERH